MVKRDYQIEARRTHKLATARMANQRASLKYSVELMREIKGMRLERALQFVRNIREHKEHIPLKKYVRKMPHRKGRAVSGTKTGKYAHGTVEIFARLLESVKANADYKGMDGKNLIITHAFASQGFARASYQNQGRIAGKRRKRKSAHLEIFAREMK